MDSAAREITHQWTVLHLKSNEPHAYLDRVIENDYRHYCLTFTNGVTTRCNEGDIIDNILLPTPSKKYGLLYIKYPNDIVKMICETSLGVSKDYLLIESNS